MSTKKLPPLLSNMHQALSHSDDPYLEPLRIELETLGNVVEHAQIASPNSPAVKDLDKLRATFTGSGEKSCRCCGRPF